MGREFELRDVMAYGRETEGVRHALRLQDAVQYDRPAPFAENVLPAQFTYWARHMLPFVPLSTRSEPWWLYAAERAWVAGSTGVALFEEGWAEARQLQFVDPTTNSLLRVEAERVNALEPQGRVEGTALLGFNGGYNNYSHWTTDQLPLAALFCSEPAFADCRLLMPEPAPDYVRDALELLGVAPERVVPVGERCVEVERLLVPAPFHYYAIPPRAAIGAARLKQAMGLGGGRRSGGGLKLFISRKDTRNRVLLNEAEVWRALEAEGFSRVVPGALDLRSQMALFDAADVVVGAHGAALANLIYCRPGARLIELFSEYTLSAHFWTFAAHAGLDYGYVTGSSFDLDDALTREGWKQPFVVSIDRVLQAVQRATARP